jgi:DNA-binding NarL/FixJ family response regulator
VTVGVSGLLVDDHALIRQGLRRAFEATDDLVVVAEAGSLSEALALERAHAPDVAVVDVNLGDGSGIEFVRTMRQRARTWGWWC